MNKDRFEQIKIGDEAEISHTISSEDIDSFVRLTGDNNPLHVDDEYAATTSFKKRVAHGMLTASFISTMIGTKLPGKGARWYEQQIRFLAPCRIGEKVRVWVKVKHKSNTQRILILETVIFGKKNRRLIEGEAKVKVMKSVEKTEMVSPNKNKGSVIVTGASRGIGAAIAKALANKGYSVIVNYAHRQTQAESVVEEIIANKGRAIAYKADKSCIYPYSRH